MLSIRFPAPHVAAPLPVLARCLSEAIFLIKASRPGFYLTAMWFYLLPFGAQIPLDLPAFWLGLFYVGFPLGTLIYAGNDIGDRETDRLNPRKDTWLFGARPTPSQIAMLPRRIALVQLPFVVVFTVLMGPRALLWFALLVAITTFYNAPRWGAKDRPGFDVLAQIGYLLVFVLANWLTGNPLSPWFIFAFGALFAMHSHLFGEVIDIAPDAAVGRRTTAVVIGARATKYVTAALLVIESVIATQIGDKPWLAPALLLGAMAFLVDAKWGWKNASYPTWLVMLFFVGWNLVLLGEIALSAMWARGWIPSF
ncbi:MAG TPA: UbiA family prenyltransferase [Abditibacterium sp.]